MIVRLDKASFGWNRCYRPRLEIRGNRRQSVQSAVPFAFSFLFAKAGCLNPWLHAGCTYVKTASLIHCLQKIKFDEECRRTWSASKRTTVSTQCTRSTVPAARLSTDSSATTTATRSLVNRSRRTYDDHSAEQQIKFHIPLLARSVSRHLQLEWRVSAPSPIWPIMCFSGTLSLTQSINRVSAKSLSRINRSFMFDQSINNSNLCRRSLQWVTPEWDLIFLWPNWQRKLDKRRLKAQKVGVVTRQQLKKVITYSEVDD